MTEFEIIDRFFKGISPSNLRVLCGIGDDAAIVGFEEGEYALSTDTLIEGTHFPIGITPADLGYRAVAVNLSDLAAVGAVPKFATLAISMPSAETAWLKGFSDGLAEALNEYGCSLIGGDTTKGPLVITLQVVGKIKGKAIQRSGARVGDVVGVSGCLGDARAALDFLGSDRKGDEVDYLLQRYHRPTPRVEFASMAQAYLNSAIDISDGLIADLEHIALSSHVGIELDMECLPISKSLEFMCSKEKVLEYAGTGGDDYELAFTTNVDTFKLVKEIGKKINLNISAIGKVVTGNSVVCRNASEICSSLKGFQKGYRHF